ncbi:MAG: efflux RND transporter periplasmic adaptor subunit [Verrucomicrobia bacterium]|nr:efflux RND transporter periplasmic adaptor subunit [Verrucomicrobiota bacterium]
MKVKIALSWLVVAMVSSAITWQWMARSKAPARPESESSAGRKLKFFQSPMHPWVTSPKPGKCTVCGMELVPVYEGDTGFTQEPDMVVLGPGSTQTMHVQVGEVERKPLRKTLRVAGVVEDDDTRHRFISATVDGRIDRLMVNYVGAEVEAGKPLAALFSPVLLKAEREFILLTRSPRTADSETLLSAARTRLKRLGLSEAAMAALADKAEDETTSLILAPETGTVVNRFVYEGQYVKEGDKLFETADFSTMWFKFEVYEKDLPWIQPGQEVEVSLPSQPGRLFSGVVRFLDPNANEMTRSLRARVELPNPLVEEGGPRRRALMHRVYAEAVVRLSAPEVLAVPRTAVLATGQDPVVYLEREEGVYQARRVRLGRLGDEVWEVLEGLEPGDRVVLQGNLMIDAQAQLNQITQPRDQAEEGSSPDPAARKSESATDKAKLDAAALESVEAILDVASGLAETLAADDLARFVEAAKTAPQRALACAELLKGQTGWEEVESRLRQVGAWSSSTTLVDARKQFYALAEAAAEAARALKRSGTGRPVKVFRCPMTKSAFPGAPRSAVWIQRSGPIRNPYFGAEMLDCGAEVTR